MLQLNEKYIRYCDIPEHIAEKLDDYMIANGVYRFIYFDWVPGFKEWCVDQGLSEHAERVLVHLDW